jgi:hypothetical protein
MTRARFACALLALAAAIFDASCSNKPPHSPKDELKSFRLPPGFRMELVASEPDISDPVAMAFDERGRIYAVEMPGYPLDPKPSGRIKLPKTATATAAPTFGAWC